MTTTEAALLTIGDVARRTGLTVSAIRYYSDEGLVRPTDVTDSGHRLYDLDAITRLELIRTLRDLEVGLDRVRRVLAASSSLRDVLAEHLEVVEKRAVDVQTQRAVLRALVREQSTAGRASLLRRLVTMSDADRARLVDEFWADVSAGLPADALRRLAPVRPHLPADPSPRQLDAWITLAELLGDEAFRSATRAYLHDTYATGPGAQAASGPVQEFIESAGADLVRRLMAAHEAGLAPDDPRVRALAAALVEENARAVGVAADDGLRERMAAGYRHVDALLRASLDDPDYAATHGRYLELVSVINDEPHPDAALAEAVAAGPGGADAAGLRPLGQWLAAAFLATGDEGPAPEPQPA